MQTLYTIKQLSDADWFPARFGKIYTLMRKGKIESINVNPDGQRPVYRITQKEVDRYLKSIGIS